MRKIIITALLILTLGGSLTALIFAQDGKDNDTKEAEHTLTVTTDAFIADNSNSATNTEDSHTTENTIEATEATTEALSFEIDMNFVGDIMLAGNETGTSRIDTYSESEASTYFFEGVRDIFMNDDITIANCENVFTDNDKLQISEKGQTKAKESYEKALAKYKKALEEAEENGTKPDLEEPVYDFVAFWFRCKSENAKLMKENGVDVVSLDNNHTHDFGMEGFEDTKTAMDKASLDWGRAGKVVYKEKNGFKIAFVIGSMYYAGDDYDMINDLEEAKKNSDYQVIFFHGGEERLHAPEQWKIDSCRSFVDLGADLVVGCHPHVLQPMETYNGVNIVYSLGNFIFGGNNYPENATAIYNHKITVTKDKSTNKFTVTDNSKYNIIPCFVYTGDINNFQPAIVDDYEVEKQIILDFMEGKRETPF